MPPGRMCHPICHALVCKSPGKRAPPGPRLYCFYKASQLSNCQRLLINLGNVFLISSQQVPIKYMCQKLKKKKQQKSMPEIYTGKAHFTQDTYSWNLICESSLNMLGKLAIWRNLMANSFAKQKIFHKVSYLSWYTSKINLFEYNKLY